MPMKEDERINASPLCWPSGKPRVSDFTRKTGNFGSRQKPITVRYAVDEIYRELGLMGIPDWQCIISSNLELRQDGDPRSGQRAPIDPGAAVWWRSNSDKPYTCVASDRYVKVEHNLWAIAKTIGAIRGIERWSGEAARDQAFTGFKALPSESTRHWSDVLEMEKSTDLAVIKIRYQHMRGKAHPDKGGSSAWLHEVQKAWEQAQAELST